MRNRNGFSLIELLAVLVIIGLILLVVIPATARLLTNNDAKEYSNYLKIIKSGATVYADDKQDELGTSIDTGCIEVTLDKLVANEYIKEFNNKDVSCLGTVRLNNNKGNLEVSVNVTCTDMKSGKETYKKEEIKEETCIAFKPKEDEGLKNKIKTDWCSLAAENCKIPVNQIRSKDTYIMGSNPNNFVWYSGKLWRIVNYNEEKDYVKLISNDIITVMPRNLSQNSIKYGSSLVDNYLKTIFLPSLKDYNKYLKDTVWDVSPTVNNSMEPDQTETVTRKVALLNAYDSIKMGSIMPSNYSWLNSNYNHAYSLAWVTTNGGTNSVTYTGNTKDKYYGIRPAITMKTDNYVISGNGTLANPYILEGNSTNVKKGTKINTRYSGEYLKINNVKYRIVKVNNGLTKIIMDEYLGNKRIFTSNTATAYYKYSLSNIKDYLNNTWFKSNLGADKNLIEPNGSWCETVVSSPMQFKEVCNADYITAAVALPTLGDLYTSSNDANPREFWTINMASSANAVYEINTINISTKGSKPIDETADTKPVMYLKSNVIIKDGEGTSSNPFTLELK